MSSPSTSVIRTGLRTVPRAERLALFCFAAFTVVAVVGFGVFVQSSWGIELLGRFPMLARLYASSFAFFAQVNIALSGLVLVWYLYRRAGWSWIAGFAAVIVLSLGSELVGTTSGLPFGIYEYTELLGTKLFGRVPIVIPLSWFTCAVPAYAIALRAYPGDVRWRRVGFATLLVVLWDLTLDPAMSYLTTYWVWGESGLYFGMPVINLVGWALTAIVILWTMDRMGAANWVEMLSPQWMVAYYGILILLPAGMCLVSGVWIPVLLTAAVAILLLLVVRRTSTATGAGSGVDAPPEPLRLDAQP